MARHARESQAKSVPISGRPAQAVDFAFHRTQGIDTPAHGRARRVNFSDIQHGASAQPTWRAGAANKSAHPLEPFGPPRLASVATQPAHRGTRGVHRPRSNEEPGRVVPSAASGCAGVRRPPCPHARCHITHHSVRTRDQTFPSHRAQVHRAIEVWELERVGGPGRAYPPCGRWPSP